jgi:SNF2 family DNA or RNA helicase
LHRAALEWSLAEPIIIERAEDIRSRPQWQDRVEPFEHQVQNLFTFCRRLPVLLLADDVGLGKTISAGLILRELMKRRRVSRTLVICPKILTSQWEEELDTKFGVPSKIITGAYQKLDDHRAVPVVITTYQSALRRLERIARDAFDLVILDEAHKLRNLFGTPKPPQMALRIREALEQRLFKYVLLLTATPIHNRLWDAYSLVDLLAVARGHKNPFGDATEFRNRFIARGTDGRQLVPGRAPEFRGILRQYLVRTRRSDAKLEFPGAQSGHVARNPHG